MLALTRKYFQILKQLDEGVNIDGVDAKLRLTTLKPLHAQWFVKFYNEMTIVKGKHLNESGWRAMGLPTQIRLGSKNIPGIGPFHDIDALLDGNTAESQQLQAICDLTLAKNG